MLSNLQLKNVSERSILFSGPDSDVKPTSVPDPKLLSPRPPKQQPKFQQTTLGQYRTGPQPCPICSKNFNSRTTMEIHMRVHTKEKPFSCEICNKCFSQRSSVKTHFISFHPEKKAFKCGTCGKTFSLKFYKVSHEKSCRRNFIPVQGKENKVPDSS